MKVLSLFDGVSCGQLALDQLGIKPTKYYASELDKYAMAVTQHNYPNTIQMGDVTKWREWDIDWSTIDLVQGGSPCQGFSRAGTGLNFEHEKSKLFFVLVDILNHVKKLNPIVKFLLENVRMKKEWQDIISEYMEVEPIMINSALVSAQNRVRLYWTNIGDIDQPEDRGILLKDIVINNLDFTEYVLPKEKTIHKLFNTNPSNRGMNGWVYGINGKSPTLTTNKGEGIKILVVPEATKKGYTEVHDKEGVDLTFINSKTRRGRLMKYKSNCLTAASFEYYWFENNILRKLTPLECERLQTVPDNYTLVPFGKSKYFKEIEPCDYVIKKMELVEDNLLYNPYNSSYIKDKHPTLTSQGDSQTKSSTVIYKNNGKYYQAKPNLWEVLQTVPEGYTLVDFGKKMMSNSQRYKMLGNGWTIEVIKYIFKDLS